MFFLFFKKYGYFKNSTPNVTYKLHCNQTELFISNRYLPILMYTLPLNMYCIQYSLYKKLP